MMRLVLIDVPIISIGYDGMLISAWRVIWSGYVRVPSCCCTSHLNPYGYLVTFFGASTQPTMKCINMICSHRPRHHHRKTSLLTHVILYKIRVRPGYFIKRVGQNVTRLTWMIQMTRPDCNAGTYNLCKVIKSTHIIVLRL